MLKAPKAAPMVSFPFYLAKWHPIKQQKLMLWNTELIGVTTTIKLATLNQSLFSRSPNLSFNNINFIMSSTKVALRYLVPCLLSDCAAIDFSGSQVMLAFPKMSLLISQPKREQTSFFCRRILFSRCCQRQIRSATTQKTQHSTFSSKLPSSSCLYRRIGSVMYYTL